MNPQTFASTFIGNGGQAGDVELAVSLKQLRSAVERIESIKQDDPNKHLCECPEDYSDHNLCEVIEKLNVEQKRFCDKFILKQLSKLDKASTETQFEWVESSMLNKNKLGVRVVDAVAQKDKKKIYIDQVRFIDLTPSKRLFLLTHELFHMDSYENINLDDEDKIGPFTNEYGVRDLLNAAAAGIVLTSIDENVFQSYSGYLNQSRSTKKHWLSLTSPSAQLLEVRKTNFDTKLSQGHRLSYQYQPDSFYNFGFILHLQTQKGSKTIFDSVKIEQSNATSSIGVSYRYFIFNHLDPLSHFWNTFMQFELLYERLDGKFSMKDERTSLESQTSSISPAGRLSLYAPIKYNFWINAGIDYSQHKLYYSEFDYTLEKNTTSFYLGVTYGL